MNFRWPGALLAQGGETAPDGSLWILLLNFLPILLVGYFLLYRPREKQEQERRKMLSALKKNDKILTSGGVYGTVVSLDSGDEKAVIRVDDDKNVRLTVSRSSIVRVVDASTEKDKPAEAPKS